MTIRQSLHPGPDSQMLLSRPMCYEAIASPLVHANIRNIFVVSTLRFCAFDRLGSFRRQRLNITADLLGSTVVKHIEFIRLCAIGIVFAKAGFFKSSLGLEPLAGQQANSYY